MSRNRKRKRYGNWLWDSGARKCHYCGLKLQRHELTADHVKPLSAGGYDKRKNIVPACNPCNQAKKSQAKGTFIASLKTRRSEQT